MILPSLAKSPDFTTMDAGLPVIKSQHVMEEEVAQTGKVGRRLRVSGAWKVAVRVELMMSAVHERRLGPSPSFPV